MRSRCPSRTSSSPSSVADAEEHLELVLVSSEAAALDERERLADQPVVVRRDPDIGADVEERLERVQEVQRG